MSWKATATSGLGKRVKRPSASIALAPLRTSSAGWPIITRVPRQRSLERDRSVAAPTHEAMWTS